MRETTRQDHRAEDKRATELLTGLRARLLQDAFLFDDPATYQAGVMDAFDVLESQAPTLTGKPRQAL